MSAPIPAAEAIGERNYGGVATIRVLCPWCSRTHVHPRPKDPTAVLAGHCGRGSYTISQARTGKPKS